MGVSTSPATGARGAVRVGEETVFGVAVAPTHLIDFTSESITAAETAIVSEAIRPDRGIHALIRGNLDINGDVNFEQSTSGFGMLLRHSLGDYILADSGTGGTDGGIHGRSADAAERLVDLSTLNLVAGGDRSIIKFTDDQSTTFEAGGVVSVVYRDANDALQYNDNSSVGYGYDNYAGAEATYVSLAPDTAAQDYTGVNPAPVSVTKVTLADVLDDDGNAVKPDFNPTGGVVEFGDRRIEYEYFEYNATTGEMWLSPGSVTAAAALTPTFVVAQNDGAIGKACISRDNAVIGIPGAALGLGTWIYQFSAAYGDVYTHHLERGRFLPTGLTIEVDRDAAVFLYTGMKVNTLTLNFETNAIVTGTINFIGQKEFTMAELLEDAVPGDTTVVISDWTAFLTDPGDGTGGGTFTIGEETELTFTSITDNQNGTYTMNGVGTIARFHPKGSNVDPRSTTEAATTFEGSNSPLTSFETTVYMRGAFEEVLSGSLTLNNNLNGDKFGLGSRTRLALVEEQAVVEASVSLEFDDGKHYKRFIDGETFALEFRAISEADDSEIGNTGVLASATYFAPKCKFSGTTPLIASTSFITHDMPLQCIVDDEFNTTDLVIILVNGSENDVVAP